MNFMFKCGHHEEWLEGKPHFEFASTHPETCLCTGCEFELRLSLEDMRCAGFNEWYQGFFEVSENIESAEELMEFTAEIEAQERLCKGSWSMMVSGQFDHMTVFEGYVELWA